MTTTPSSGPIPRHYGLDWLRIAAFALLILFHVGMFFVPWDWHIKTVHELPGVAYPMMLTQPWRMTLLFVVSGYASRALLSRSTPGGFAASRTKRLLIPLLFGMAVIVVPQPWVQIVSKDGYAHGLGHFWLHDYFRPHHYPSGMDTPTWMHLWFVVYALVYSWAVAACAALLPARIAARLQDGFARALSGWRLLALPIAWLALLRLALLPGASPTNGLFDDAIGHAMYLPAFLFGFALAGTERLWPTILRWWKPAIALALAGYALMAIDQYYWPDVPTPAGFAPVVRIARCVQQWAAIVALLGLAQVHWNRDHPWRATLSEAVFPFYIIHQTATVLIGFAIRPLGLPPLVEFAILLGGTAASCLLFYLVARASGPLRPLAGLPATRRPRAAARAELPA